MAVPSEFYFACTSIIKKTLKITSRWSYRAKLLLSEFKITFVELKLRARTSPAGYS